MGAAVFVSTGYWYLYLRGTPDEGAPATATSGNGRATTTAREPVSTN